jgi:hypothetical protein
MANIKITDLPDKSKFVSISEIDLKDLSNVEQNNVQGGSRCIPVKGVTFPNGISGGARPLMLCF